MRLFKQILGWIFGLLFIIAPAGFLIYQIIMRVNNNEFSSSMLVMGSACAVVLLTPVGIEIIKRTRRKTGNSKIL